MAQNKTFIGHVKSRKLAKEAVGPLDNERIKGKVKESLEMAEKPDELAAPVFTGKDVEEKSRLKLTFSRREAKELNQAETTKEKDLAEHIQKCF